MENQPSQPNRPKSQIYLQRASQQSAPPGRSGGSPSTQTNLLAVRPALPVLRSSATQRCPNCGAVQPASTSVCMACGAFIPSKAQKKIRCRRCGTRASANLVLCPGCGRELQAAPPRVGLFLASLILMAFFLVLLTRASRFQPMDWMQAQATTGWAWIRTVGDRLDPQLTINTVPTTPLGNDAANNDGLFGLNATPDTTFTAATAATNPEAFAATTLITTGVMTADNPAPVVGENSTITGLVASDLPDNPTMTVTLAATLTPTVEVIPTIAPATPTLAPSPTPSPTATTSPTASPLPTTTTRSRARQPATATAQAQLAAGAGATSAQGVLLQPTATPIPSATSSPTVVPTPTPVVATPTANVRTYTVRAGDTPFAIATQFNISVIELLTANGMGLEDARRLRVGQELIIATANDEPTAVATPTTVPTTATATSVATGTPTAPAATPTAASTVRLDPPQLRSPEPNSFLSCNEENTLTWLPVAFIRENDQYRLHLGFLTGYNGTGAEEVTWVLEQLMPANTSLWRMDQGLCGLAPQSTGRQWRWYVEVVEAAGGGLRPVSQSSAIWGFSWN